MNPIDPTTQSLRIAMGMSLAQAEIASRNISRASQPGAQAQVADFSATLSLLQEAECAGSVAPSVERALSAAADAVMDPQTVLASGPIQLDAQVADAADANLRYQALGESLSRHFALLRLAITGRS